jgi:hypothetical protein
MPERFVVTGSGRCGTKWVSTVLTAAGVPCGHEAVYGLDDAGWGGRWADSSWMAACHLPVPYPVALLVRHPLAVVRSFVEIGFMGWQLDPGPGYNPCHDVLRGWAPDVYEWTTPADRCLAMWWRTTTAALAHAEILLRLEGFDAASLARLLRWAGHERPEQTVALAASTPPVNQHETLKARTKVRHDETWAGHDPDLAAWARALAATLGYADA